MRKFLCDYETVLSLDEVRKVYEDFCDYKDESSFSEYLFDALGKNGSLTEILTIDTPSWNRKESVCFCAVVDEYTEDVLDDTRWLNWYDIMRLQSYGYRVLPTKRIN